MLKTIHVLAVLGVATLAACARNPATGKNELMLVSESQEVALGQQYDQQVIQQVGLYPDSGMQRYIQQFGERLAANSERPNLQWTFRVVDDPAVNAFAVPGGHVYVTRGILANLNSEAELASVVGHEIGHVAARHTAHEMSRQQLAGMGLGIAAVASPAVAQFAGAAQQAMQVMFLKFSRDDESQADELGLRYLARAQYDPSQMPRIFSMLERQSQAEGGSKLPQWLETHPDPGNRKTAIEQQIAALPPGTGGTTINRDSYIQRLDGLTYGTNPRDGYFKGTQFFHPGLRFQVTFPQGWQTVNGMTAVQAVSAAQDAALELTVAQGQTSADAAARSFLSKQGITGGVATRASLNGLPAVGSAFTATTPSGTIEGTVLFVEHAGAVYQIAGYGTAEHWAANQAAVEGSMRSFQQLTDPAALNVQPQKLEIFTPPARTTITDVLRQRPSPLPADRLALVNQVDTNTSLDAGHPVKWIVGLPSPSSNAMRQ
ncbi:MAG TPA: M48 family metalloprotease [Gemmatimonadales bacterium]|jgi:predicted Zn-dependent protease